MTTEAITRFFDEYRFLSNFYPVEVEFDGVLYPSVEHAYVAAKTLDLDLREQIRQVNTAGQVKRLGKQIILREDWEQIKVSIMTNLVSYKFLNNPELYQLLLNTKPKVLIEGNTWGDTFWGQCPIGKGRNELGKILMALRDNVFEAPE